MDGFRVMVLTHGKLFKYFTWNKQLYNLLAKWANQMACENEYLILKLGLNWMYLSMLLGFNQMFLSMLLGLVEMAC